jgi:tripartite-type tricarboxylate transporter receptor subunit TctC
MMDRSIRTLAVSAGLVVAALAFVSQPALAEDYYPTRPITFLQGYAPGGTADVLARIVGQELSASLGQPVVVEARPGAGGNLASEQAVRAAPDGYTLVMLTTAHVISPSLYKRLAFDPINDFEFIGNVVDAPYIIAVNENSPYKNIKDLAAAARASPGTMTVGTAGVGTGQHICEEIFATSIGTKFVHVPFRGDAAAVAGLLSHTVDMVVAPGTALRANIKAGKFRALATSSPKRWAELPDVPTIAETVAPGYDVVGWLGVATRHGTPKPVIDKLGDALKRAMAMPSVVKQIENLGLVPHYTLGSKMKDRVVSQISRWHEAIVKAGIEPQ